MKTPADIKKRKPSGEDFRLVCPIGFEPMTFRTTI